MSLMRKTRKYCRKGLRYGWKGLKTLFKCSLMAHMFYFGVAMGMNYTAPSGRKSAMYVSDYCFRDSYSVWSPLVASVIYPYVTILSNYALDARAEWVLHAQKSDLIASGNDRSIENIFTFGHGGQNWWRASDQIVWNQDVRRMATHDKSGYWFQVSCAYDGVGGLGRGVMPKDHLYTYQGLAQNPISLGLDAILGFPVLRGRQNPHEGLYYYARGEFLGEKRLRELAAWTYQG